LPLPANDDDKVSTVLVNQGDKPADILLDKSTLFSMETTGAEPKLKRQRASGRGRRDHVGLARVSRQEGSSCFIDSLVVGPQC
jgi:hypothetical protein